MTSDIHKVAAVGDFLLVHSLGGNFDIFDRKTHQVYRLEKLKELDGCKVINLIPISTLTSPLKDWTVIRKL
jgi:hypothetical protein